MQNNDQRVFAIERGFGMRLLWSYFKIISLLTLATHFALVSGQGQRQLDFSKGSESDFDANGYYFPVGDDVIAGVVQIKWLEMATHEYFYNGDLHFEEPRKVPPSLKVNFSRLGESRDFLVECVAVSVNAGKLSSECLLASNIKVRIDGEFLDRQGKFWDRDDIKPRATIVLVAEISKKMGSAKDFTLRRSFTYWSGH